MAAVLLGHPPAVGGGSGSGREGTALSSVRGHPRAPPPPNSGRKMLLWVLAWGEETALRPQLGGGRGTPW